MVVIGLILSLAIGVSLGLLGGGGSTLTVPVVHYVFGIPPHDAIAMSLVVVGITSGIALVPHARAGRVHWRTGLTFGASSMAAAFAGGHIGAALPGDVLMTAFASLMLLVGCVMLVRSRRRSSSRAEDSEPTSAMRMVLVGVVVGLITGILGAGGGFIIVPALTLVGGLAIRSAVGTSLLVIMLNSLAGLAGAASHSHFHFGLTVAVAAVAVAGSVIGARVVHLISAQVLQRAFGGFVVAVGLFIIATKVV